MTLYTIAQRRSFFQRALEGVGDVGRFFSKDDELKAKIEKIREIDQQIRQVCLTHGAQQQSLKQDLIACKRELQANNLLEAHRYLAAFNMALQSVVSLATKFNQELGKTAGRLEELYQEPMRVSKEGLESLLTIAEDAYYITLKPIFEKLDQARASAKVEEYLRYLSELILACGNFDRDYQQAYQLYVMPILDIKSRHRESEVAHGDRVRKEIRQMMEEMGEVEAAEECPCGSGKAYLVCCGLDKDKIYSIMKRERALGGHITYDQAVNIYIKEFNRNMARRAEREAAREEAWQEKEQAYQEQRQEEKEMARRSREREEAATRRTRMAPAFLEAFGPPKTSSERKKIFKQILAIG